MKVDREGEKKLNNLAIAAAVQENVRGSPAGSSTHVLDVCGRRRWQQWVANTSQPGEVAVFRWGSWKALGKASYPTCRSPFEADVHKSLQFFNSKSSLLLCNLHLNTKGHGSEGKCWQKERAGVKEIVLHYQSLFTLLKFSKSGYEQIHDLCFPSFNLSMPFSLLKKSLFCEDVHTYATGYFFFFFFKRWLKCTEHLCAFQIQEDLTEEKKRELERNAEEPYGENDENVGAA